MAQRSYISTQSVWHVGSIFWSHTVCLPLEARPSLPLRLSVTGVTVSKYLIVDHLLDSLCSIERSVTKCTCLTKSDTANNPFLFINCETTLSDSDLAAYFWQLPVGAAAYNVGRRNAPPANVYDRPRPGIKWPLSTAIWQTKIPAIGATRNCDVRDNAYLTPVAKVLKSNLLRTLLGSLS